MSTKLSDEQLTDNELELLREICKPLPEPQFNPCKRCGRTSITPACGMCGLLEKELRCQPN